MEPIKVTLLDPMALMRDSITRALRQLGFIVVADFAEAQSFLAGLSSDPPDVAVANTLAYDDALSLVREVRQFHPNVPVLAVHAGADPQVAQHFIEAGASGYLDVNASTCESLAHAIQAVSRGERVFPSLFLEAFLRARAPADDSPSRALQTLSMREREVLAHLAAGADNERIAQQLAISERTVKAHVSSLYRKLAQKNRTQLALMARQLGIRPPEPVRENQL